MTEKAKKKESRKISRREFLKDAGLLAGGAAIGSTVLLAACGGEEVEVTTTKTVTNTATTTAPGGTTTVTATAAGGTTTVTKTATQTTTQTASWSPGTQLGEGGELPEPRTDGDVSIEETLLTRRSIRTYSGEALTLGEVSQLLWAAQGITSPKGFRTAPSASATYTLETYLVVGDIDDLAEGVYRYQPAGHKLVKILDGKYWAQLTNPAAGIYFVEGGAIYLIFTGVYSRIGEEKWVHMEVGHATQNVYLQAVALGLGTVVTGGINGDYIREILELPENEQPLYAMPVGRL